MINHFVRMSRVAFARVMALFSRCLPRFSNDFTGHVETGPRLAFESQGFLGIRAFSSISMVPVLVVLDIGVSFAFTVALRIATLTALQ